MYRRNRHSWSRVVLLLMTVAAVLVGCTDDSSEVRSQKQAVTVEAVPHLTPYTDLTSYADAKATRAWTPPAGYVSYSTFMSMFPSMNNLTNRPICTFFTRNGETPQKSRLQHSVDGSGNDVWHATADLTSDTDYYLYGFIPDDTGITASIAPNGSYSNGAVLTLNDVDCVSASETCVIVGAKEGTGPETVTGLYTGQFVYHTSTDEHNYLFLLFDHLYSALQLRFTVSATYDVLRTIKIKDVSLKPCNSSYVPLKEKADIVVRLARTPDATSPIQSITFTSHPTGDDVEKHLFTSTDGIALAHNAYTNFQGGFCAPLCAYLLLETTYDVYDKEGNLIRENQTRENRINLSAIFSSSQLDPGYLHSLTIVVNPTYLYTLSDDDLDNPKFVITTP